MKSFQEVIIGMVTFLLLDRFARAISTTVVDGMDDKEVNKVQIRIELLVFVMTLFIVFKLWF